MLVNVLIGAGFEKRSGRGIRKLVVANFSELENIAFESQFDGCFL